MRGFGLTFSLRPHSGHCYQKFSQPVLCIGFVCKRIEGVIIGKKTDTDRMNVCHGRNEQFGVFKCDTESKIALYQN